MGAAKSVRWSPKKPCAGWAQRLNNLSFPAPIRQEENDDTYRQVAGYQALKKIPYLSQTGHVADIRDDLATLHDNP